MTDLPPGWRAGTLRDVVSLVRNGIFARRPTDEPGGVPILRISAVRAGKLDLSARKYVTDLDPETTSKYAIKPGDLLFTRYNGSRDLVGRCARVPDHDEIVIHPDKLIRIVPRHDVVDSRFLALLAETQEVRRFLEPRIRTTAGQSGVTGKDIQEIPIRYPSPLEQRRIVDILEGHFSRLDAATTVLAQATQRASAYKVAAATTELEAAGGEFVSILAIASTIRNGIFVSRAKVEGNGVPILRIGAVRPLSLDLTDLRYSERDLGDLAANDALLDGGDLLFTRYNGNPRFVGACAVVPSDVGDLTYPDKLIRVKVNQNVADPRFVALACSFGEGRRQIQSKVKTTSGQSGISGADLKRITIALPDLRVQTEVMRRVQAVLDQADRTAAAIAVVQQRGIALRRALLDVAFSGRLTGRASDMDRVEEMAGV